METPTHESDPSFVPNASEAAKPVDLDALSAEAKEILGTILPLLSFEAKLHSQIEKENIRIRMECEDAGRLIGRRGSTVNEIQFLLNRILQRRHKVIPRIFLDVDGPREIQPQIPVDANKEVVEKVRETAASVRRWGDPAEVGPLTPADRKAIQDLFAKDKELEIVSINPKADPNSSQKIRIQLKS